MSGPSRRLLLAGGAAVLASCSRPPSTPPSTPTPVPSPATAAPTTPPPPPALPRAVRWTPAPLEVEPTAKVAAVRVVEALGTGDATRTPAERLAAVGANPALAEAGSLLVAPALPSVTTIVYPQYGGLEARDASVMVVAEQTWRSAGRLASRTLTVDVRLLRTADGWAVSGLRPVEVVPTPSPDDDAVARLLADERLRLPDAAARDLAAGAVDRVVVDALATLAGSWTLDVSVLMSGHPRNVYGATHLSNHTLGRAVDVWAIDDVPVVERTLDDPVLHEVLRSAARLGATEVGGPVVPGGGRRRPYFADRLHRDHVHVGFDP